MFGDVKVYVVSLKETVKRSILEQIALSSPKSGFTLYSPSFCLTPNKIGIPVFGLTL
jgi:hypothetical protein